MKRACKLQDGAAGFPGCVSTVHVVYQSRESFEVVVAAALERLNEVIQVFTANGVKWTAQQAAQTAQQAALAQQAAAQTAEHKAMIHQLKEEVTAVKAKVAAMTRKQADAPGPGEPHPPPKWLAAELSVTQQAG